MPDSLDVVTVWPDKEVTLRIHIQKNLGHAPPPKAAKKEDGDGDAEADEIYLEVPAIVYPIDEAVLRTRETWTSFLEDATGGEETGAIVSAICLRTDYPLLLKRLTKDRHVRLGKHARNP